MIEIPRSKEEKQSSDNSTTKSEKVSSRELLRMRIEPSEKTDKAVDDILQQLKKNLDQRVEGTAEHELVNNMFIKLNSMRGNFDVINKESFLREYEVFLRSLDDKVKTRASFSSKELDLFTRELGKDLAQFVQPQEEIRRKESLKLLHNLELDDKDNDQFLVFIDPKEKNVTIRKVGSDKEFPLNDRTIFIPDFFEGPQIVWQPGTIPNNQDELKAQKLKNSNEQLHISVQEYTQPGKYTLTIGEGKNAKHATFSVQRTTPIETDFRKQSVIPESTPDNSGNTKNPESTREIER